MESRIRGNNVMTETRRRATAVRRLVRRNNPLAEIIGWKPARIAMTAIPSTQMCAPMAVKSAPAEMELNGTLQKSAMTEILSIPMAAPMPALRHAVVTASSGKGGKIVTGIPVLTALPV